jgi:hypothetical protein
MARAKQALAQEGTRSETARGVLTEAVLRAGRHPQRLPGRLSPHPRSLPRQRLPHGRRPLSPRPRR